LILAPIELLVEVDWRWMEVDGGGWRWMEVDGGGWRWIWRWIRVLKSNSEGAIEC